MGLLCVGSVHGAQQVPNSTHSVKKRTQAFLWAAVYEDKKKENTTGRKQKKFMFNVSRQELFSFHTSPFLLPQTSCSGLASLVDNRSEAWVLGGSREDTFSCRRSVCLKVAVTPHGHNNKHWERQKDVWSLTCFRIKGDVREESGWRHLIILPSRCFSFFTRLDLFLTYAMILKCLKD